MKRVVAILLSVVITVAVVVGVAWGTNKPAQAAPDDLGVCVPPLICATVSVPVPVTVRATVRVTEIVTLPPVVRTIIQPRTVTLPPLVGTRTVTLPPRQAGTKTVTVPGLPGATKTDTVVVSKEIISNGTAPPVTREVRSTVSGPGTGQTTTTSATVAPRKEVVRIPGTTKTVTKFQAVGLSLLALLALMGLGLFLLWLGFVLGYKSSEKENNNFLRALRDSIRRKPGKHE